MKSSAFTAALSLVLAAIAGGASAHEAAKGPNGGPLIDISGHHVEFVASGNDLIFILTGDKDAPIASSGAKMKAIVQAGGKTNQIDLMPVEPNKLQGKSGDALTAGTKVVITGTLSDGHNLQGRFVVP